MTHFNGPEYKPERDKKRLTNQLEDIKKLMFDGKWRTLAEISQITGHPESSISAQLRHLRKPRFGSYTVEREHLLNGLYKYRVIDD